MAQLVLQLEDLIKLDPLHLSNLCSHLEIRHFILAISRISEDLIKLHHGLFKCLDLQILRLHRHEELVKLLDKLVDLLV